MVHYMDWMGLGNSGWGKKHLTVLITSCVIISAKQFGGTSLTSRTQWRDVQTLKLWKSCRLELPLFKSYNKDFKEKCTDNEIDLYKKIPLNK